MPTCRGMRPSSRESGRAWAACRRTARRCRGRCIGRARVRARRAMRARTPSLRSATDMQAWAHGRRLDLQRGEERQHPRDLVPGRRRGERIGEAATITRRIANVRDHPPRAGRDRPPHRPRRFLAAHGDRPIEARASELPRERHVGERGRRTHAAIVPDARINPDPGERRIVARNPGVVVVREQMELDVRPHRLQVRERRRREEEDRRACRV